MTTMKMSTKVLAVVTILAVSAAASAYTPLVHLLDGGFEITDKNGATVEGWNAFGTGYAIETNVKHAGAQSIRCDGGDSKSVHGALCNVTLDQTAPTPIVLSGWSKADDVSGAVDLDYSLYVDIAYVDGAYLYGQLVS